MPLGEAAVAREGTDLTIVAHSYTVQRALRVADQLSRTASRPRSSTSARCGRWTSRPSPPRSARRTARSSLEEGWATYGVGAELAARIHELCFDDLDAPVERVGQAEVPMPYSKPLELAALPLEAKIEAAARRLLQECGLCSTCPRNW